ncbi:MAG: FeoB-associated Cys-rich membrane protein [Clostridia bacterium]|nr:FeoB-associated Cys-rich membrane protein [Clostridia bacterium]
MENYIAIAILALILGGAIWYIIRAKKSGKKCIGCPESGNGCCHCQEKK